KMIGSPLIHRHQVFKAGFSPDSRWVVTLDFDDNVQVWDAATSTPITPRLRPYFLAGDIQFIANGNRILAKTTGPGIWTNFESSTNPQPTLWREWDIAPEARSVDELIFLGQLLSGHRSDPIGSGLPLGREALELCWEKLTARHPSDFAVSEEENIAWHRR